MATWPSACPECRLPMGPYPARVLVCPGCMSEWVAEADIWRCIRPARRAVIDRFLADYSVVRRDEGRGSDRPDYYLNLPSVAPTDSLAEQWRMRSVSWQHVRTRVFEGQDPGRRVLDLGAGVGWLSHLVDSMGHLPLAVDLSTDPFDGLGAARHYPGAWPRVEAEFDRLPIERGSADIAVFNASFHYSADPVVTLTEVRRVLRPGGTVVVMDSPSYRSAAAGDRMVAERRAGFGARFGIRSDSLGSIDYLTPELLDRLTREVGVSWRASTAWYGWRWWSRPGRAALRGRRPPSRFVTLIGRMT